MRPEMEWVPTHDLKPWEHNPRINEPAITKIAHSIKEYGFLQPIVINQDNVICAGHTRWLAAKSLDMMRVPVIRKEMSEQEFIAFNLIDNKSHETSKWNKKQLKACMELLDDLEPVKCAYFSDDEIDKIFGHKHLECHASDEADFGDAGVVDDTIDEDALVKRMTFAFTGSQYKRVRSKLQAIKKEHNFDNMAEALIQALKYHKGMPETKVRKRGAQ